MTQKKPENCRASILGAAVAILRQYGFAGFTQPRVAKLAAVRQSHLTYYFPTRLALLEAVGRIAVDNQLAALDALARSSSFETASRVLARLAVGQENTRVLMALAQGADEEPSLRTLFRELTTGIAIRVAHFLQRVGLAGTAEQVAHLHATAVGLALINLATQEKQAKRRAEAVLLAMFSSLAALESRAQG